MPEELASELVERVLIRHPLPVADALAGLVSADGLHEKRDRVVECFRAAMRLLSALALSVRVQYGTGPGEVAPQVEDRLRELRRRGLTDGQWLEIARELCRPWAKAVESHPLPPLVALFHGKDAKKITPLIDGLLEMRKSETIAHGGSGDAPELHAILSARVPQLGSFLEALDVLWASHRLVATLSRPEPGDERQSAWLLQGTTPSRGKWRRIELAAGARVDSGRVALLDADGKPKLALHPIAMLKRATPEAVEELFFLEGGSKRGAKYVAFPSMAEHDESEVWGALEGALSGASSEAEDAAHGASRPYRGLESFRPEDAPLFFGRGAQSEALANRIRRSSFVTVTGASGSGKSSLLHAGVIPRLTADGTPWRVITMRPGGDPTAALAARLVEAGLGAAAEAARAGTGLGDALRASCRDLAPLLLVVDQAEEVFTLAHDVPRRDAFGALLADAASDPNGAVHVMISLREEFFARLATIPALRELASRQVEVVTTPGREALEEALVAPAQRFGVTFEDWKLVEAILAPLAGEPGALALLQFCADRLWDARDRSWKRLTWDAYRALGGVEGALATHAETTLLSLTPLQQRLARSLLLRLVTPEGTRIPVGRGALLASLGGRGDIAAVIDRLIDARLLVALEGSGDADDAKVELVHETLVVKWARLRGWLDEDRDLVEARHRVAVASALWERERRPPDLLLGEGKPLAEGAALLDDERAALGEEERQFVLASLRRQRRRVLVKRGAIAGLFVLMLVAVAFAVQARVAGKKTEQAKNDANTLLQASRALETDPNLALAKLLELEPDSKLWGEAWEIAANARQRGVFSELSGHAGEITRVAFSPAGIVATIGADRTVRLWKPGAGAARILLALPDEPADLSFSGDGRLLAIAGRDGVVRVSEVMSGTTRELTGHRSSVARVFLAADGSTLWSIDISGSIRRWTLADGASTERVEPDGPIAAAAVSARGTLATASAGGTVRLHDATETKVLSGFVAPIRDLAFSADGRSLAAACEDGKVRVSDSGSDARVALELDAPVVAVRFREGSGLAAADASGRIGLLPERPRIHNAESGFGRGATVVEAESPARRIALTPDSRWLAWTEGGWIAGLAPALTATPSPSPSPSTVPSASPTPTVYVVKKIVTMDEITIAGSGSSGDVPVVDLEGSGPKRRLAGHTGGASDLAFSSDGTQLAVGGRDSKLRIWDVAAFAETTIQAPSGLVFSPTWLPDGTFAVTHTNEIGIYGPDGGLRRTLRGDGKTAIGLVVSPDGRTLAGFGKSPDGGRALKLYDLATDAMTSIPDATKLGWAELRFTPDSKTLLVAEDGVVKAVDLATLSTKVIQPMTAGQTQLLTVSQLVVGSGGTVAAAREDGRVRVTDLAGAPIADLQPHDGLFWLRKAPCGRVFSSGTEQQLLEWNGWSLPATVASLPWLAGPAAFDASCRFAAMPAYKDSDTPADVIMVVDLRTFEVRSIPIGNPERCFALRFLPDGKIAAACNDGLRIADPVSGRSALRRAQSHNDDSLEISPDGRTLLTTASSGKIYLWSGVEPPLDPAELKKWIRQRTNRTGLEGVAGAKYGPRLFEDWPDW